jgi:fibronectin-binding autotransporter adhesin
MNSSFRYLLLFTIGSVAVEAATVTYLGSGTLSSINSWDTGARPTSSDEVLFQGTLESPITTAGGTNLEFGNFIWNSNSSSTIALNTTSTTANAQLRLTNLAGSIAAEAAGGAVDDLIVLGSNAVGNTVIIEGNLGTGTARLDVRLQASGNINVVNAGGTLDIATTLTERNGIFGFTKTGAGTLILRGSNSYTGGTTLAEGTLGIRNSNALGTGTLTINGGTLGALVTNRTLTNAVAIGGNFTAGVTIAGLTSAGLILNGDVDLKNGIREFTTSNSLTLGGVVSDGGIVKKGSANLTLSADNTYTGATEIDAGAMFVNGSLHSASVVTVGPDGTLGGSGTINGATTISGAHRPGATATGSGQQTFGGSLTYNESAQVYWDLGANSSAGVVSNFDQVVVGGNLNFTGATAITLSFTTGVAWSDAFWNTDQSWTVYSVGGTTSNFSNLSLTVANWADSTEALFNTARPGASFSLIQSGEDVILAYAIPEPATYAVLLGLGALGAAVWLRRRRS